MSHLEHAYTSAVIVHRGLKLLQEHADVPPHLQTELAQLAEVFAPLKIALDHAMDDAKHAKTDAFTSLAQAKPGVQEIAHFNWASIEAIPLAKDTATAIAKNAQALLNLQF